MPQSRNLPGICRCCGEFRYTAFVIKAIFFDFDGVLTTDDRGSVTTSKNLCARYPHLSFDDVLACYRKDIDCINVGACTMREVWKRMCAELKITDDYAVFQKILRTVPMNESMLTLARSLKPNYVLGIITSNSEERIELITADLKLNELFDPIIVSAVLKSTKKDGATAIFDAALAAAGCRADEAVFIDNQEKCLEIPATMGFKTYFHDDTKNDMAALRRALKGWEIFITV